MTTKNKTFGSLCLAVCLLAGLFCADAAFATVLNFPLHYQEKDQWCWDATSQAILEYYGVGETQTQIAAYGTPGTANTWNYLYGTETDPPPVRNGVDLILHYFAGLTSTHYTRYLSQGAVLQQINSLRPVAIRWGWNDDMSTGHILAIKGIAGNTVYLMDPWDGDVEIASYNWVVKSPGTGGHTWTHSLTIANAPPQNIATIDNPFSYSITTTGATAGADLESVGAAMPTATGVAYGKREYPAINGAKQCTVPVSSTTGGFYVNLRGLAANTIYHFRGYATSPAGTAYSADATFTTVPGPPTVTAATAIRAFGFTAHWKAPSGNAPINYYNLDVATDPGFTNVIQQFSLSGTYLAVTVSSKGKYYYRVSAVNAGGTGAYSGTISVAVH